MIIDRIKISNFGLYRDDNYVELSPNSLLNRNITVISGQNGVGKSTLLEAIHLCLLGSLSIDNRVSEANYERYLFKRAYKGTSVEAKRTSIELHFEFLKSGAPVKYKICRSWDNNPETPNEDIDIEENGKPLIELSKKEKNLFLRELIQPGLARVMFIDGEKLLALYDQANLANFIGDSCRFLFGLNFVDLLNTDLNYYIHKLQGQQDPSQSQGEINKVRIELREIQNTIIKLAAEKTELVDNLINLKQQAQQTERLISDQGRWAAGTLEQLKAERQQLEKNVVALKKELVEVYSTTGPFIFCRKLCMSLMERLQNERDIEKWRHAKDLFSIKLKELESKLQDPNFLKLLEIDNKTGTRLFPVLKEALLSNSISSNSDNHIYHEMADGDRTKLLTWIDNIINNASVAIINKSMAITQNEERLKGLIKELSSFSKDDLILPLLRELQEVTRSIGANEQKLDMLNRHTDETNKRKEFYTSRLAQLEDKLVKEGNVDERLKLSSRTKIVLESYAKQLMAKKLLLLKDKVLQKFNLLCRKESYLDNLIIDPESFELELSRKQTIVDHIHLSAGEKQLLIVSILWGLRELTNIALPLIIDTPLARLDLEHRRTFIEQFLPSIQPQVILIGTDMELAGDVIQGLDHHIAHQYSLAYNAQTQSTQLSTIERTFSERMLNEV